MENEIVKKIEENQKKLEQIYASVEKTRKYFLWTLIISVVLFFLPLIALVFLIPFLLSTLTSAYTF